MGFTHCAHFLPIYSVLARLLSALPPTELMACHEMKMGLTHPNSHVYSLTLDCIHRGCVDSEAAMILARRADMLKLLASGWVLCGFKFRFSH